MRRHVGHVFVLVLCSAMKKPTCKSMWVYRLGAGEMNRTPDLLITNELLYRLSYTGVRPKL